MNKVSWRRILQRAGHEFPSDRGGAVIQMREGSQIREHASDDWDSYSAPVHPGDAGAGVLESELKRALDRAARRDQGPKAAVTPPGWEPIFMAQELGGKAPPPVAVPKPDGVGFRRPSSGGRNLLAISLSAVVVGLAFQQISAQWSESRTGGNGVSAVPEVVSGSATALYADASASDDQSGYGVQPSNEDARAALRPSLTEDAPRLGGGGAQERDAFLKEIEQAASVLAAQPQRSESSRTPVTPVSAPLRPDSGRDLDANAISGAEEQSMLRRARELMERGHISGARLIFEHLALQQSALGAFALAQTYDEKFLKTFLVKGMEPDPKLAAKWYRRAAELGSQVAERQ